MIEGVIVPWLLALHLGALHPVEKVLTLVLAFGPFLLLGVVILVRRRSEDDDAEAPPGGAETSSDDAGVRGRPQRER